MLSVVLLLLSHCLGWDYEKYYMGTGEGRTKVPGDIPSYTLEVHLSDNRIQTVPKDAFSSLARATYLGLSGNRISTIRPRAFRGDDQSQVPHPVREQVGLVLFGVMTSVFSNG